MRGTPYVPRDSLWIAWSPRAQLHIGPRVVRALAPRVVSVGGDTQRAAIEEMASSTTRWSSTSRVTLPEDFNQVLARMDELGSPATYNHFTGTLNRVLIQLSDETLSPEDEQQIQRAKAAIQLSQEMTSP
jgi:hypothetical protein